MKLQLDGVHETPNTTKSGPSKTKTAHKPKTRKVAPQHVQDQRRERVKDKFPIMGTPEETYESKAGKVLKTGRPPWYPWNVCRVKHWWFHCPVESN